ncbi:MAG: hypothetical protein RMJ75_01570 [Nitrososphaerota archaeon]|nr:hypothetical protein [Nitrososphaerota archaeon]
MSRKARKEVKTVRFPVTLLGYRAVALVRNRTVRGLIVDDSANLITLRTDDGSIRRVIKSECEKLVLELDNGTKFATTGSKLLGRPAERLKRQKHGWERPPKD